ncbi:MAG: hypothetical protein JWP35_4460 [Caulobacter sp.]|nr:hypothetical protein [Caulobacter sp.]
MPKMIQDESTARLVDHLRAVEKVIAEHRVSDHLSAVARELSDCPEAQNEAKAEAGHSGFEGS